MPGWRVPGLELVGVELQGAYAELARRNAAENGIAMDVVEADLRALPPPLRTRGFDQVLTNPPYFRRESGTAARDAGRDAALGGPTALDEWIAAALRRLRPGGRLTLIQRAERLPEILAAAVPALGRVVVQPVAARTGRAAGRVLVSGIKGARGPFRLGPPLVIHRAERHLRDGDDYTDEMIGVLRHGWALHATHG